MSNAGSSDLSQRIGVGADTQILNMSNTVDKNRDMKKYLSNSLPTTIEEFKEAERYRFVITDECKEHVTSFKPLPTDVFITPFGQSGTTWIQQIVHGLRTRGDMDFDDIERVIPWFELAYDLGVDLNDAQRGSLRAFKSHSRREGLPLPDGLRYIVSIRNPKDVFLSRYRFYDGYIFEHGTISIEEFAQIEFLPTQDREPEGYWAHLLSWWEHRHDENILMMSYEDMRADLPGTVRKIAAFLDIELDDELFDIVVRQSSLDFMLAHKKQFSSYLMRQHTKNVLGIESGNDSSKVRVGKAGAHKQTLPDALSMKLDEIWERWITAKHGLASYEALQATLP